MIEYCLELFKVFVDILKIAIPLYILFDIVGDLLWRKSY